MASVTVQRSDERIEVDGRGVQMRPMRSRPMQLALTLLGGHVAPSRRAHRRRRLVGIARCESPLEYHLAHAFALVGDFAWRTDQLHPHVVGAWLRPRVALMAQAMCGRYRVDFAIVPPMWRRSEPPPIVVEVDGHEFHERTKEQAAYDRSRDRWMSLQGITVLRFTGSEIWADPDRCAAEVLAIVSKQFA